VSKKDDVAKFANFTANDIASAAFPASTPAADAPAAQTASSPAASTCKSF